MDGSQRSEAMICPSCGHDLPEDDTECLRCGVVLSKFIIREVEKVSLDRRYQQLSDEEIERLAQSDAKKLNPDATDALIVEILKRGLSDDLIAALVVPQKKLPQPNRMGLGWKHFLIVSIILGFLLIALLPPNLLLKQPSGPDRYDAMARSELYNAVATQEDHYATHRKYCRSLEELYKYSGIAPHEGVKLVLFFEDEDKYQMMAYHEGGDMAYIMGFDRPFKEIPKSEAILMVEKSEEVIIRRH